MGQEGRHARLKVTDGSTTHDAVMWACTTTPMLGDRFDLAFVPELNEYRGRQMVQLKVLDWTRTG